jgi:hypothetical protein
MTTYHYFIGWCLTCRKTYLFLSMKHRHIGQTLKNKHNLSILILAHTPKRNFTNPLSNNDLQGSKMLANFIDSSIAIGKSYLNEDLRYIKQ